MPANDLQSYLNSIYSPEELQASVRKQRQTGVYDPTMANALNLARDKWNAERMGMGSIGRGSNRNVADLSYPELSSEAQKLLARDQSRLAQSNYPAYTGKNTVPMSTLTQRQRELQERFRSKEAPYAKKIESVLNRNAQGLSPDQTQGLLDMLRTGHGAANEKLGLGYMQKQFGERYGNREGRLREKGAKDLARVSNTSKGNLEQLGTNIKKYENDYNENLVNTLRGLQGVKQNKRENLVGLLGEYGNQEHTHGNLVNDINKGEFNRQVNEPYRKMDLLKNFLQGQGNTEGVDAGVEAENHKMLQQALRAYGVDTSKPVGEWEKNRIETPKYPGQLVADLTPEMQTSHNLAERINPKWQEATFGERKRLEKEVRNKEPLGTRAVGNLPEKLKPYEENLDWATKKMIKNELGKINKRYEGMGTYGSQAHLGAVEKKQRELLRRSYGERENLLHGALDRNVMAEGSNDISELRKLMQLGQISKDEFDDIIKKNKDLNQLGTTKWGNEQNKLGNEYQNFQNELSYEWPNLRQGVLGELGNKRNANTDLQKRYDLDLDELRRHHGARFSELEKENRTLQEDLINRKDYLRAQQEEQSRNDQLAKAAQEARRVQEEQRRQQMLPTNNSKIVKPSASLSYQQELQKKLANITPPPEGAFYSPENGNWYTRPLVYNNEYVNEPWKGAPNFARGVEQAANYAELTGGPKFPHTGAGGWSGNYAYKDIMPMFNVLKNYQYS